MAQIIENEVRAHILLRYDTYSNWMNCETILRAGEVAICTFPFQHIVNTQTEEYVQPNPDRPEHTPPAIGLKVGDGESLFWQLPWVQGVAADVYPWAKASSPPDYTAEDIIGLENFVKNLVSSDVEVTIAPRIYQFVQGTGNNANKYYLQYKENNEQGNWIIDTSSYIDLSYLSQIITWIGDDLLECEDLSDKVRKQVNYLLSLIKVNDKETAGYFVTSVSQINGQIETTKKLLNFSDIKDTLSVTQGGTGRKTLTDNTVLVGNGTDNVKLIPIADSIANNNYFVPNYVIKNYIDNATSGITGAMHFIGESTVTINNGSTTNPNIIMPDGKQYNFSQAESGDVILYDSKEFVWTGGTWRLLGDEGSYAIKGSIKDADIDADAEIQQSKIANLAETFDTKVDKEDGKSLTSNDFTDELKQKLENIQDGATQNTIEHILLNGVEIPPDTIEELSKAVNLEIMEFDENSQAKLSGIEFEAQVNKIEKIIFDGIEINPDENKVVSITSNPHTEHENKIESIYINGKEWAPNADKQVRITIDPAALQLEVIVGAVVPSGNSTTSVPITNNKELELSRIAMTGNVQDLLQTTDTYIILDCGSSTTVV